MQPVARAKPQTLKQKSVWRNSQKAPQIEGKSLRESKRKNELRVVRAPRLSCAKDKGISARLINGLEGAEKNIQGDIDEWSLETNLVALDTLVLE